MNYYPFHIGDYASATRHLSWDEDMAYRRLMDAYYTKEEPIPLDRRQAYRLVCATTEEQRQAVDVVLQEFFEETPDGWRNGRCDAELDAFRTKSAKASQSAQARWSNANAMRTQSDRNAGAEAKTGRKSESGGNDADAMQPQSERNANASPDACERMPESCEGNAPKTNTNISIPNGIEKAGKRPAVQKPEGVTDSVWADFLTVRKAKRAPLTSTALEGIQREASKARMSLQEVLQVCCARGWQSFKAEWINKPQAGGHGSSRADLIAGGAAAIFEGATHV